MKGGRTVSKLVTIVCAALLTLSPWSTASAQANVFGQTPSTGWQKAKLSQAIVNDANQAVENLVIANESGHITASDFDNAATSLQILWDHLQEIGFNQALQNEILANQDAFLDFHPTDSQVDAYHAKLASDGVNVSALRVRSAMDPDFDTRQEFLSEVKKVGLYQAELEVVAQLRQQAKESASEALTGANLTRSNHKGNMGHMVKVTAVCWAGFILAGIGLASGCTVTAVACGASLAPLLTCALGG